MDGWVTQTFFDTTLNLLEEWNAGNHARELGLNLMFHCWYLLEEPVTHIGYDPTRVEDFDPTRIFNEIHDSFALEIRNDPEMLYVIGTMAQLTPWALGDETVWTTRSLEYQKLYAFLEPSGLDPKLFEARDGYGKYFAHQLRYAREHPRT